MTVRGERGFSIAELMVAMGLFGMMAMSMACFQSMAFKNKGQMLHEAYAGNSATMVRYAVARVVRNASYVAVPSPGAGSAALTVYENVDPADGTSPLVSEEFQPRRFHHLCLDSSKEHLYLYEGPLPMPGISCGSAPAGLVERTLVAGGGEARLEAFFSRPSTQNNVLLLNYSVEHSGPAAQRPTKVVHRSQYNVRNAQS